LEETVYGKKGRFFANIVGYFRFRPGFAALFLLLATKSSPLYPLNDWVDAISTLLSARAHDARARCLTEPLRSERPYGLSDYGLASLISGTSFLGVYLLEVLAFGGFLYAVYKIVFALYR
jgi:hypothetical protein